MAETTKTKEEIQYLSATPLYKGVNGQVYGLYPKNRTVDVSGLEEFIDEKLYNFSPKGESPLGLTLGYGDATLLEHSINLLQQKYLLENLVPQVGVVSLTNSLTYPFNNSETTVVLENLCDTTDYRVEIEVLSGENLGDIRVSQKQLNGFKLAYSGSCPVASLKYYVIGGY